jgi:radical SAM protein with 4Fe4S-binding SPASM domain
MGIVTYDGKFGGCLSVDPELNIQGDLLTERPGDVWENKFRVFRDKEKLKSGHCTECDQWIFCLGGGLHERNKDLEAQGCTFRNINSIKL